jgi:siroheme synthase (precorrin-2 oxidase/ferrochelatase)
MCETLRKVKNRVIHCGEAHAIAQNVTKSARRIQRLCYVVDRHEGNQNSPS